MPVYTSANVPRHTVVTDTDTRTKLSRVHYIDTDSGELRCYVEPLQVAADGETILSYSVFYEHIYPVFSGMCPTEFHCTGFITQTAPSGS